MTFIVNSLYVLIIICPILSMSAVMYTHDWAVKLNGGEVEAIEIANKYGFLYLGKILEGYYLFRHMKIKKRSIEPSDIHHEKLISDSKILWAQQQVVKKRIKRDVLPSEKKMLFLMNDPFWTKMWYLNRGQGLDMNVEEAWLNGATGKGIVVTILDDGIEASHPDLKTNYDPNASYDVNDHDNDPSPHYDDLDSNRHGTRCAGEVAAVVNNSICAVGIAFNAKVGGVRMLDGDVTDAVEAQSLSYNPHHIDIYSASWGPEDDGKTVDGPGELATKAFINGIEQGRNGKGSIFIWASGNGGNNHDNCNCDGYTNSIWTLSISSATENGHVPWYSEACSSTLAATYSSGEPKEGQIISTDLRHRCTMGHTGTSASAPLAAGICALVLSVNNNLTWRDMQHLVVRTAHVANLKSDDWQINGVGRKVSHSFGYGLLDAASMVKLAKTWKTVPQQTFCLVKFAKSTENINGLSKVRIRLTVNRNDCPNVQYMEHVQAKITLTAATRGDVQIYLMSPSRTKATLLASRPHDTSKEGFVAWPFMAVHFWGEQPYGTWCLDIHNNGQSISQLHNWDLLIYGTFDEVCKECPSSYLNFSKLSEIEFKKTHEMNYNNINSALSSKCLLVDISGRCLECHQDLFLVQGMCLSTCPSKGFFVILKEEKAYCIPCHFTCRTCFGSNNYECHDCQEDYVLHISPFNNSKEICYPPYLATRLESFYYWYIGLTILFLMLFILILGILIALCRNQNPNELPYPNGNIRCGKFYSNDLPFEKMELVNLTSSDLVQDED